MCELSAERRHLPDGARADQRRPESDDSNVAELSGEPGTRAGGAVDAAAARFVGLGVGQDNLTLGIFLAQFTAPHVAQVAHDQRHHHPDESADRRQQNRHDPI